MSVKINLAEDLRQHFLKMFKNGGFRFNTKLPVEDIVRQYFNLRIRTIEPCTRPTFVSKEMIGREVPDWIKKSVNQISSRSHSGKNLIGHLSDRIQDPDYHDALLNDWGIHHFHLGFTLVPNSAFYSRTKELLYVRATNSALYFIDILDHDPVESFANRRLLEIIHNNWPEIIMTNRIGGIIVGEKLSNLEIDQVRQSGLVTFHAMDDGTTYAPAGGGYATDGSNVQVTRMADQLLHHIWSQEKALIESEAFIRRSITEARGRCPEKLVLKLKSYDERGVKVIEGQTKHVITIDGNGPAHT